MSEWTLETTDARREEWNAMVRAGMFGYGKGGHGKLMCQNKKKRQESAQGWTLEELCAAIKYHYSTNRKVTDAVIAGRRK